MGERLRERGYIYVCVCVCAREIGSQRKKKHGAGIGWRGDKKERRDGLRVERKANNAQ